MDESATGSTNFFPSRSVVLCPAPADGRDSIGPMHLRPPSIDHGVVSAVWAVGLGLFILLGLVAVGLSLATAVIFAAVAAGAIFLFVRLRGEDDLRA